MGSGEPSDGSLTLCFESQAFFDRGVQFFDLRRSFPLDFLKSERFFRWHIRRNQIFDQSD